MLAPLARQKRMQQVAFLKNQGMGHGHANVMVHVFRAERGGAGLNAAAPGEGE